MELREKKQAECVAINVFVKCDKCDKKDSYDPCEYDKKDDNVKNCVKINVFVECDNDKK